MEFPQQLKIQLYDPEIPLLCIYLDKNLIRKHTCTPMFIAALFTIAKTWKQPKCPSTDEWINKIWYIHTMEYYSTIKSNEIMLFAATWMDLETFIPSEVSQTEKDKYHMLLLFSCSVMSSSLPLHGLQHTRLLCPSPTPRACSNSCPLSW